ncbi:replication initiator protein [Sigmofec virus UA08Rod_4527]|uniref:Replication initiator protein n=1 Tax=Sigmofec virus UA08Rod_4527 TaxID=2929403 RepID=A0A976N138_9VIRU|nr:replication initiator protein [Sigmofec virus UA08Rod_4527]
MNGIVESINHSYGDLFEYSYFYPRRWSVTKDNIENFVACDTISGECINVYLAVPCGKCQECRNNKFRDIYSRCMLEQYGRDFRALFFTLTYSNEHLPSDGVSREDIKKFFNRFYTYLQRTGYDGPRPRHIVFSEYSPHLGRAHYHGLIFGLDTTYWKRYFDFTEWFETVWGLGYTHIKHFEPAGFKYACKYLLKGSNVPLGKNPNFWFGSRNEGGIGSHCLQYKSFLDSVYRYDNNFVVPLKLNTQLMHVYVPKFIRDKICSSFTKFMPPIIYRKLVSYIFYNRIMDSISEELLSFTDSDYISKEKHIYSLYPFFKDTVSHAFVPVNPEPYGLSVKDYDYVSQKIKALYIDLLDYSQTQSYNNAFDSFIKYDTFYKRYKSMILRKINKINLLSLNERRILASNKYSFTESLHIS